MFNNLLKNGKINNIILGDTPDAVEKPVIRKYHKYFRQRDTLLNIPKELEEYTKLKDEAAYTAAKQEAAEKLAELGESKTETLPIYDKDYGLTDIKKESEE
jgi:hypothetical protein